jgi:hypothetical protein
MVTIKRVSSSFLPFIQTWHIVGSHRRKTWAGTGDTDKFSTAAFNQPTT